MTAFGLILQATRTSSTEDIPSNIWYAARVFGSGSAASSEFLTEACAAARIQLRISISALKTASSLSFCIVEKILRKRNSQSRLLDIVLQQIQFLELGNH